MSAKRKCVVLSLEDKLSAIERLDWGETLKKVASDLGIGKVTVGDRRHKSAQIEEWVAQQTQSTGDENIMKKRTSYEK